MAERKHKRFRVTVPIFISLDGDVYRKMIRLECRDLSAGGLSFETNQEIPLEADSRVVISKVGKLPDSASIEARVVHRSRNPLTGRYWVGVEFTRFNNVTLADIEECIGCGESQMDPTAAPPTE